MTTFADLDLIEPLQRAVAEANYVTPTPIQAQAIPPLLEGRDVLGCAQTGTGKTAAFALPVIQHIASRESRQGKPIIRALVLSPTRELAAQIGDNFEAYARFLRVRHVVIFGGVSEKPQIEALRRGVDVLVATPGRLLDLLGRGYMDLSKVEFFVLDEADRMLDMGFIHDIRRVLKVLPAKRQNLLFSATMPNNIVDLGGAFLDRPVRIDVTPPRSTLEQIEQSVMFVERKDKRRLLADLIHDLSVECAIVFTRTKHGANRLVKQLDKAGIQAAAIHGNKSQNARRRALEGFKSGTIPILVATDIASRGIDVDGVSHVFNFDLPNEPEVYVHRIGRTGRAGRSGVAIAFCDTTEGEYLRDIERLTGMAIPVDDDHIYHLEAAIPPQRKPRGQQRRGASNAARPAQPRPRPANPGSSGEGTDPAPNKRRRRRRRRRPNAGEPTAQGNNQGGNQAPRPTTQPSSGASDGAPQKTRRRRRRPPRQDP